MNIQSVQAFDAAVGKLNSIKGDVTSDQLNELTSLFSTQIWNTSDAEGNAYGKKIALELIRIISEKTLCNNSYSLNLKKYLWDII